jgi:Kelch motif protein
MRCDPRSSRRTRVLAPAAAGIILTLAAAGCGGTRAPTGTASPTSTVSPTSSAGTPAASSPAASPPGATQPSPRAGVWQQLPPAPVTAHLLLRVSVWTGRQLLLHGIAYTRSSNGYRGVTFGYTPATGTWRRLAPGPAPRMAQNGEVALWTGSEMLVIGLTNAAYNPATNTWRRIAPYNGPVGAVNVWTGHQVILWGGGCCGGVTAAGGAYDPATGTWRKLPPSPLSARHTTGAWTGTEVIIAGGWRPKIVHSVTGPQTLADAAAYNPATRTWRKLPPMPQARSDGTGLWAGSEFLYLGGTRAGARGPSADGFAFSPSTGRWRRLPAMEVNRAGFAAVWTGHQVLVWGGWTGTFESRRIPPHGLAYDPAANQWSALPMAPLGGRSEPAAAWTGSQMVVWGGMRWGPLKYIYFTDGAAYRP